MGKTSIGLPSDLKEGNPKKRGYVYMQKLTQRCKATMLSSCQVMSTSLRPHGLQHARLPCPSPSPRVCSNSCPLNQRCHPTVSACCPLLLLPSSIKISLKIRSVHSFHPWELRMWGMAFPNPQSDPLMATNQKRWKIVALQDYGYHTFNESQPHARHWNRLSR